MLSAVVPVAAFVVVLRGRPGRELVSGSYPGWCVGRLADARFVNVGAPGVGVASCLGWVGRGLVAKVVLELCV